MGFEVTSILLASTYFVIVLLVSYWSARRQTTEDYLIASRNVGSAYLAATLGASLIGGDIIVATTALAYEMGMAFLWFYIGWALGFLLFPLIGKRIKELSDTNGFYTFSDFFANRVGKNAAILTALLTFVVFFFIVIAQFVAGGLLVSSLWHISYPLAVILAGIPVLLYVLIGGFKAVVKTDLVQFILILLLPLLVIFSFQRLAIRPDQLSLFSASPLIIVSFVISGILGIFISADVWQRAYAAKSQTVFRRGFVLASILFFVFGVSIGLLGVGVKNNFLSIDANDALFSGLAYILPGQLLALAIVIVFASLMSTLDTAVFVTAMNVSRDAIGRFRPLSSEKLVTLTRRAVVVIMIAGMLLALTVQSIISIFFIFISFAKTLAPSVIGALYWRLKERAVILSISTGVVSVVVLLFTDTFTSRTFIVSLPVSTLFLIVGQIFFKERAGQGNQPR